MTPGLLLSVDPGVRAMAWALFQDGVLSSCGYGEDGGVDLPLCDPAHVVIEIPQIYQQRKQKGDSNDLIDLAFQAGFWARKFVYDRGALIEPVRPRKWKGTRPKHVCNKVTLNALTEEERRLIPDLPKTKLHNVLDAIGIGLWRLGRR